jgi:hypothetical protein
LPGELWGSEELRAAVLLVRQVLSVVVTAAVVTPRLVGADRLERALAGLLVALSLAVGVPLLLGMVGLLRLPAVLVVHVALAAAAVALHRRRPLPGRERSGTDMSVLEVAALGATSLYLALGVKLSLHAQRSFDFDTKEYHLSNLSSWLQKGHIWGLPYSPPGSMTANHPSSGEVFGLWLALPSHGDELVYLAPVVFGLLAVLAGAVLGRELVTSRDGAALGGLAALAVVTAPIYFAQVDTMLTDLIAGASVVTGATFLVLARRQPERATGLVLLAGLALGLGMGSKYTALLPGLVVGFVGIFLLRRSRTWWWIVPGVLVLAAPWYLRNVLTTGNPLFPQPIGPIEGARSPYDVLEASLLDQVRAGEGEILRRTATLARQLVGPVLVLVTAGIIGPLVARARGRDGQTVLWVGALAAAGLALYAATPYTGGGPTGLAFIIASCFRYALVGVLLAAVAGVVLAGRWAGGLAVGAVLAWNVWKVVDGIDIERSQLEVTGRTLAAALIAAVLVMLAAHVATSEAERLRRAPLPAVGAILVAVGLVGAFAAYHRLDRGRTPTQLEATLLAFGEDEPAIVIGVADLRAVLGPRLDRPLVKVHRGGAADEIPFADENQLRRQTLGEDTPPAPASLGDELDDALAAAEPDLLVAGTASPVAFPEGWRPDDSWCFAGGDTEGAVFVRLDAMLPGVECVTADQL